VRWTGGVCWAGGEAATSPGTGASPRPAAVDLTFLERSEQRPGRDALERERRQPGTDIEHFRPVRGEQAEAELVVFLVGPRIVERDLGPFANRPPAVGVALGRGHLDVAEALAVAGERGRLDPRPGPAVGGQLEIEAHDDRAVDP
jgi:hypothetical protein